MKPTEGLHQPTSIFPSSPNRTPRFRDPDKDYLELSYEELEERNLKIRERVESDDPEDIKNLEAEIRQRLTEEDRVKAITIYWADLNGKLHHEDLDKKQVLEGGDNLTFDGSSISGFSTTDQSDLRFSIDWASFRWAPADVFGKGKVIVFANVNNQDGSPYEGDFRQRLRMQLDELKSERNVRVNVASEVEGILLKGRNAEQNYDENIGLEPATPGGYCDSLPQDKLKLFIDHLAESTRALGFRNEKDHPEVAPGQFELTYRHQDAQRAADQILLYKLTARQIAANMEPGGEGVTASFLPKPISNVNGNGMHLNLSVERDGKNLFYDAKGPDQLAESARMFIAGVLKHGRSISLGLNSTPNSERRLDPNFEAPNEVKVSGSNRAAMIRIPIGNEKSARMEVRSVAPDANPYLALSLIIRAGMEGVLSKKEEEERELAKLLDDTERETEILPTTIHEAIREFETSEFTTRAMGATAKTKYLDLKKAVARRSPEEQGNIVKNSEIIHHHEVTNQMLWKKF